jgi:hypothetical protein
MSPARRLCLLAVLAALTVSPAAAAAATPGWTPSRRAVTSDCCTPQSIASNPRGDVVAVFSDNGGLSVARARAHRGFGARVRIPRADDYPSSRVAIDSRGVAIIAFTYEDGTEPALFEGREESCCFGVRVVVWRPGRRPTTPRTVFPRGSATTLVAVAATRGHRGVLVAGEPGRETFNNSHGLPTLVPVGLDGRLATRRTVARRGWAPATLQWVRGRAVVGLTNADDSASELAVARQSRRSDAFGAVRRFGRLTQAPTDYEIAVPRMIPDGRGGHVVVWARASSTGLQLFLGRASLTGPLRATLIRRDIQGQLRFGDPAVASDRWIVVAWGQSDAASRAGWYVTTRSPRGRLVTSEIRGVSVVDGSLLPFATPIAAAAPGGRGAVALDRGSSFATGMRIVGLRSGRPLASAVLDVPDAQAYGTVLTANRRDPARALFRMPISGGRVSNLVLESRLR